MKRPNEGNASRALIEIMPFVTGGHYRNDGSPDEKGSQQKEVDYVLKPDSNDLPTLAVEHTIVEAFRGQKTYVNRSYEIIKKINSECKGHLPSDRYFILVVPHILVELLRKKSISKFIEFIAPWVVATAQTLLIDDQRIIKYEDQDVHLMCGGSHPDVNGTIGRIPGTPKNQKDLSMQSLWSSIEHGLAKFSKYKQLGYDTVLSLENISGAVQPSMLLEIEEDLQKRSLVAALVDYMIVFASNEDEMIIANIWKEKQLRHNPIPYTRRFGSREGKWIPFE